MLKLKHEYIFKARNCRSKYYLHCHYGGNQCFNLGINSIYNNNSCHFDYLLATCQCSCRHILQKQILFHLFNSNNFAKRGNHIMEHSKYYFLCSTGNNHRFYFWLFHKKEPRYFSCHYYFFAV